MSDKISYEQVKANRKKWIDFLREDGRKKAKGVLDRGNEERCCLGHACYVLGVLRRVEDEGVTYGEAGTTSLAPDELLELLGLRNDVGAFKPEIDEGIVSLAALNDYTNYTPKEIGDFIEKHYDAVFMNEEEYERHYGNA